MAAECGPTANVNILLGFGSEIQIQDSEQHYCTALLIGELKLMEDLKLIES